MHRKVAVTTLLAALATVVAALRSGTGDATTIGAAVLTLAQGVAGYLTPAKPATRPGKPVAPKPPRRILPRRRPRPFAMYDTVDVTTLPVGHGDWAVAGYVGGSWPTYWDEERAYPHHRKLSIAVNASETAECLDVEPGDASPSQVASWVKRMESHRVSRPVVYISLSSAQSLLDLLEREGIGRSRVRLWTAHYTYRAHICGPACGFGLRTDADATQWTDRALGRNLDESLCAPGFL